MNEITWKDFYTPAAHQHGPEWAEKHGMAYDDYLKAAAKEAYQGYLRNTRAVPVGAVKVTCTGRNTHKSTFLGWVRLSVFKDGEYGIGMSETGGAQNVQNVPGPSDPKYRDAAYWPLKNEDDTYIPGINGESYRFFCGRCKRDVQIVKEKLGHAVHTMLVNRMKYFDLSALPFA